MITPRLLHAIPFSSGQVVVARAAASSFANTRSIIPPSRQQQSSHFSTTRQTSNPAKNVVVVDGVRLPFAMSSTIYEDQLAVDLQCLAFQGLITKTALDESDVDYILAGNVIQEARTRNIARETDQRRFSYKYRGSYCGYGEMILFVLCFIVLFPSIERFSCTFFV